MSYIALYRKWRPKTFTDVVGQKQVSETLMRAIREDRVAHAYLFSGPRGTGKTSMAKIFARALNCQMGPTDHPCNTCEACLQSLQGQSMDVVEIDAASNRGIDEVRALRESIKYLPVEGRKKVFIIDEAHMLTTEAWNALLKTIEEPPAHVLFIFATTEVEKLPVTILSRCQRFTFRRITAEAITEHLLYISKESEIDLEPAAARLIAVQADGGLRDALSLLDQCAGMTSGKITVAVVEDMVGLVNKKWLVDVVSALYRGDGAYILHAVKGALQDGSDVIQLAESLAYHIRALLLAKVLPEAEELSVYESCREEFSAQSKQMDIPLLQLYMQTFQQLLQDAKKVENARILLEMSLLGLCAGSGAQVSVESRISNLERQVQKSDDTVLNRLAKVENSLAQGVAVRIEKEEVTDFEIDSGPANREVAVNTMPTFNTTKPVLPKKMLPPPKKMRPSGQSSGGEVNITGGDVLSPSSYKDVHQKAMTWLKSKKCNMTAGYYKLSEVIYIDEVCVAIAFRMAFNVRMASTPSVLSEAQEAFSTVLQRNVRIHAVLQGSPEARSYIERIAKNTVQSAAPTVVHTKGESSKNIRDLPKWDENYKTDNPVVADSLKGLSQEYDIYIEVIDEED